MAVDSIRQIFKGMFAAHATASSAVPPPASADDFAQLRKKYISVIKPIPDAAANATYEWPLFSNMWSSSLVLTGAKIVPFAALTADNSHYKTVAINRRVAAGAATVMASVTTQITGTGDWVALTPITLTLSATAANLVIPTLADITLHLVHTGNGVAVPVHSVTLEYYEL
jgi:hypothetical protein